MQDEIKLQTKKKREKKGKKDKRYIEREREREEMLIKVYICDDLSCNVYCVQKFWDTFKWFSNNIL